MNEDRYPIQLEMQVAWGDMDAFGHVNNTVYFRYFESVRIAYFQAVDGPDVGGGLLRPILAQTSCQFLKPVVFPDRLVGEGRVSRLGTSSLTMEYRLRSESLAAVVATGEAVVVQIDPETGRSAPLPEPFRTRIALMEGW